MARFTLLLGLVVSVAFAASPQALTLAEPGKPVATIVVADPANAPTLPEHTAAQELADYLSKATGATFVIRAESEAREPGPAIYVGQTAYAKGLGIDFAKLGIEEWLIRTVDGNLVLAGGRPRGTLYAVYRFLEDVAGVHWWNPFEESAPSRPTLAIDNLDLRGKPVLRYRDIYMLYGNDNNRFAARNRLNRGGDSPFGAEYGGDMGYGPPAHVHTFYRYVSPDEYFATHPEWFSLIDGKRTSKDAQLCLTNPELRAFVAAKLKAYIDESRAQAEKEQRPAPTVFDISQNDWGGMCQCDACQAIAKAEESEAGPLFDFINAMADSIKDQYPDVYIDTLAYSMTQKPPKTIRVRDNVIVRLCDTGSNFTKSIVDPENTKFNQYLLTWAAITKNLRIWDYAVNYGSYSNLPMPTVHTYAPDFRFYAEHNVEGVFTELEYPILADMRDLKVWMMMKLLEDPYRDYDALLKTFMDGFYGPAGEHVHRYLSQLEAASVAKPAHMSMSAVPKACNFLDVAFMREGMATFDQAEQAVVNDPVLLRRVRHARLSLDRAALVLYSKLMEEWVRDGNMAETMPLDRNAITARAKDTWYAQIDLRIPEGGRPGERTEADKEIAQLLALPANLTLPERFRSLPPNTVFQYTTADSRNFNDVAKRVNDPEAETGTTNRLELSGEDVQKYALPMPWGVYEVANERGIGSGVIKPEDVPGPGYHWYKMGTFKLTPSCYVYFFWSWIIQFDVGNAADPAHPEQTFDIWASVKFEGPGFPHGKPEAANAISVERLILVKSGVQ